MRKAIAPTWFKFPDINFADQVARTHPLDDNFWVGVGLPDFFARRIKGALNDNFAAAWAGRNCSLICHKSYPPYLSVYLASGHSDRGGNCCSSHNLSSGSRKSAYLTPCISVTSPTS